MFVGGGSAPGSAWLNRGGISYSMQAGGDIIGANSNFVAKVLRVCEKLKTRAKAGLRRGILCQTGAVGIVVT